MRNVARVKAHIPVAGAIAVAVMLMVGVGCAVKKPILVVNPPAQNALTTWISAVKGALTGAGYANTVSLNQKEGRNVAISYSEAAVMARYTALRNRLMRGRAATKVIFDVIDLGLTAAVPISNGTRGKTILGSLATGFKGANLSVDRNVFNEQSTATILSAMDTCVMRQRTLIANNSNLPVDRYTIYNGYADLARLFGCTTLSGALQELSENQAVAAKQAQQRTLLASITVDRVNELREIQIAFAASAAADKKLAVAFLQEMKVQGLTEASDAKEFLAAYRGLAVLLGQPTEVERFVEAARKVKLLSGPTN